MKEKIRSLDKELRELKKIRLLPMPVHKHKSIKHKPKKSKPKAKKSRPEVHETKQEKTKVKTEKPREISESKEKKVEAPARMKGEFVETSIDSLLDLIEKKGRVTLGFAARAIGYPRSEIEEWAKAMAEHGLIEINYGMFSTVLKKKSVKK
jgi:hypothetical protein